jgi:uridine kinase
VIGDKLVITDYHRAAADRVAPLVLEKLAAGAERVSVSIAGESGSGKSEIAACLAERLGEAGRQCVVLGQDDYFHLPPRSNHEKRLTDISWVGPGEVRLDLLAEHVATMKQHADVSVTKPLVDFAANAIGEEQVSAAGRDVIIAEGTYTTLLEGIDVRVFIDRDYHQTRKNRARRNRDPDPEFLERVLEIEHAMISAQRKRADVVIPAPVE